MGTETYICRLGELVLKGRNRRAYEKKLLHNIRIRLPDECGVELRGGRVFIHGRDGERIRRGLSTVFGINAFAPVVETAKSLEAISAKAVEIAAGFPKPTTFRVSARRADKSFAMSSPEIEREVGAAVLHSVSGLSVNLKEPQQRIAVEIRDRAYVYGGETPGLRGLPTGTSGRVLLLLSGGIDSPVAGFLMASRGLILDAVHFHSYPYTSRESVEKVESLARLLASYVGTFRLYSVPITETQLLIRERGRRREHTLLLRACMMRLASSIAEIAGANGLVTGDSLGQVASQTPANIRFTDTNAGFPVYRPLIGMDKEEIVGRARTLGTFETSILPFPDCCTLFAPESPITNASVRRMQYEFEKLAPEETFAKAIEGMEVITVVGPPDVKPGQ